MYGEQSQWWVDMILKSIKNIKKYNQSQQTGLGSHTDDFR